MKLIIDIPEKTIAHIRSDYGHEVKCLYDFDKDIVVDAIWNGTPLQAELKKIKAETIIDELEKIKAEITEYRKKHNCGVLECLDIIDKEIKGARRSRWR